MMNEDRLKGAFLGLAVGDALGTTLEFSPRPAQPVVTDMVGGGPFGLAPGGWTDDTSMALCLADSLLEHPGFDPDDLMRRFVNWWRTGHNSHTGTCFDIGITTSWALARFAQGGDPFAGSTDPRSAGNGGIMRLAPVVLAFHADPERMREVAALQSRTTHAAPECLEFAAQLADAIHAEIRGEGALVTGLSRASVSSSGYVRHTFDAAVWAVATTGSFREALLAAVNLGDDADTVSAVAGQIAGARYGLAGIPGEWLTKLAWRERIETRADRLIASGRKQASDRNA
ncbi:ADP-ribosylglycohydrolase family protein [Rhodobacteraceae bacterium 2CG4]|uniref:ADP-ribosylglycohydrolase family protein n=1 Tax=Halovulum marinum TaxID=2662447 RepID=A0A6L5Z708_9RHOB|nr:ADP-ribosylglycohydrolase family protein [Halovulum marinum]MSU92336.1 ADP-ribosylglycohydrolase family protein [Halovulum marinum]